MYESTCGFESRYSHHIGTAMDKLSDWVAELQKALGVWKITDYKRKYIEHTSAHYAYIEVLCPCGGLEYVSFRLGENLILPEVNWAAKQIASKQHIEEDIRKGLLPESALQYAIG